MIVNVNVHIFRQIKIEFKHVRFKSTSEVKKPEENASKTARKNRILSLADNLKCNRLTAQKIISKNRNILSFDGDDFCRNASFCQKHFKLSDVVEWPHILTLNCSLLQHRYFSLIELGCNHISACDIQRFSSMLKKSPGKVKKCKLCFPTQNDILSKYLDNSERADIVPRLQQMYKDGSSLKKIKETMNAEFLVAKLGCSIGKAHQMLKIYPPLRVQSISRTDKILNLFLSKLKFSTLKIYNNVNLLSLNPESVQHFLSKVPNILGVNSELIIQKQPLVLRKPVSAIQELESVLNQFSITGDQLIACPKIIVFAPSTLKDRLSVLSDSKDFKMLKSYKKFLWLVYNFNNLDPRSKSLKELGIPLSVNMFLATNSIFNKYLCATECKSYVKEATHYLSCLFNIDAKEISTMLREYPSNSPSAFNCQRVVEFLLEAGVTQKQILRGIGIIFYDVNVVKTYFLHLRSNPEYQPFDEWMMHYNLIQLVIYTIEVDAGFQGSRLYKVKGKVEEEELLMNYSI